MVQRTKVPRERCKCIEYFQWFQKNGDMVTNVTQWPENLKLHCFRLRKYVKKAHAIEAHAFWFCPKLQILAFGSPVINWREQGERGLERLKSSIWFNVVQDGLTDYVFVWSCKLWLFQLPSHRLERAGVILLNFLFYLHTPTLLPQEKIQQQNWLQKMNNLNFYPLILC